MSGLKQFYYRNIHIFTIILVIIALFLVYKCYTLKKETDKLSSSSSTSSSSSPMKKEYYATGTLSELALGQAVTGSGDFERANFGERGVFSMDPALQSVVYGDEETPLELGYSGLYGKTASSFRDPLGYALEQGDIDQYALGL
jgi:hypothetical protein